MDASNLHVVILAGGSGTRFWPLSRRLAPKQLLTLLTDRTMLQETLSRVAPLVPATRTWIVTGADHADEVRRQLREIKIDATVIVEPMGRNTAPAIALAAHRLMEKDPEAVMAVLPADHVIANSEAFRSCLSAAADVAAREFLVTLGFVSRRPETGYGYIKRGSALDAGDRTSAATGEFRAHRVERFVEKPDRRTAERYVADGSYLWNGGIFVWRAATILADIRRYLPAVAKALSGVGSASQDLAARYEPLESVSIDYGVLEKTDRAVVIPADLGWSDVGSWAALDDVVDKDERGNVVTGRVLDFDSTRSILYAQDRLVATIGLEDMIVVDTPDATLVCRKDRAQDVRKVVEALERHHAQEHVVHRTVQRPWGTYTVLEEGPGYKIKRIVISPSSRLSLQTHYQRSEHWVVVAGTARVTCGERVYDVQTNQSTYIPPETKHRLENADPAVPLQIIEVQSGPYLGEDDIVRFADDFGRTPP